MAKRLPQSRELHVQAPDLVKAIDLIADVMGETRSVGAREVIRRGINDYLKDQGFDSLEALAESFGREYDP